MKKLLLILLLFSGFLNAQQSIQDVEYVYNPACNAGKSILQVNQYIRFNGKDTLFRKFFLDSTGTVVVPTGTVSLGFCFKADTGALAMFKRIIDTLSSINNKMATNNLQNDTIIKRLDSLNAKTYFDSSWYQVLRKIQINIADSLRTYNYKYDSINIVRNDTIIDLLRNSQDTTLKKVVTKYQVADCNGTNIGTPQDVLKTIVLNSITSRICNTEDFKSDTSINSVIRAMQKNIADSLQIFRFQYSYIDSLQVRIDSLLAKTTFDSSWYSVLRDIRTNIKDSLRIFKYSYLDTTNARLAQLLLKNFGDTSINPTLRQLQKNVADSLRTFNYSYSIANNIQNDTIIAKLAQIANKTSVDSTLIKASSLYQVLNCNDSAVGAPQTVLKSIILNKMQATICNVSEIAGAIKTDTSDLALLRKNNVQNDTLIKRMDSLLAKQSTVLATKPLARNISGTTYSTLTNCEHLALGCCWVGTVVIQDAYSNTITLTNGEGFNFESFKGRMQGITINATGATGAIVTGVCQ